MKLRLGLIIISLLFFGCAKTNVGKDSNSKNSMKKDDPYAIVISKSIKDCKAYEILLDEKRTSDFMRKSPRKTIVEAANNKNKTTRKLCHFFAEETSLEKVEKANEFTSRIINGCEKVGVPLAQDKIHKKVSTLPFFVVKKALTLQVETSVEECELMKKKYN